jgi:ATP-dependent DNA ligase
VIVLEHAGRLEFDLLQMRLHPAESRVLKLSAEIPARFIAFDVLLWKGEEIWKLPFAERRKRLERLKIPFAISGASRDRAEARRWLERLESSGLDGIV